MAMDRYVPCKDCGSQPCICEDGGMWAAHCMGCDNSIGQPGFYDPCALTKEEAEIRWNKMNTETDRWQESGW